MKKSRIGICKLCKQERELTYEHTPPRSAFNKNTSFYKLTTDEYFKNAKEYVERKIKPKTRKEQGGVGNYCLCKACNDFLGSKYVNDYKRFAEISYSILHEYPVAKCYQFEVTDINPLNFLKQIIAIFICNNNPSFTITYPGLIEFVLDENSNNLPERYKVYMYLSNEGVIRNGSIMYTNVYGAICDFKFTPFGFVLSIDNTNPILELSDITNFKKAQPSFKYKFPIVLNKFSTIYPFPMDFRSKEEINLQTNDE